MPMVRLELQELTTAQQLQWIEDGHIDVGFLRPPVEAPQYHVNILFQESLIVALPEAHVLVNQTDVSLRSLIHEPFILFPRSLAPGLYDQIISLCQQADFSPNVTQEAIQMQTIVSLVAASIGVAIVPASLQHLQQTGVVYKPLQDPTPKAAIAMICRRQPRSPTLQRFLEVVEQLTIDAI